MAKPTYEDASLMLQFAIWGATAGNQKAGAFIWSDKFLTDFKQFKEKYPVGTEEYSYAVQICGWYETLGTLFKHGLFNRELLFDWLLVSAIWDRLKGFVLGVREEAKEPRLYEFFEAMAKAQT
jgi:hypothetical protein